MKTLPLPAVIPPHAPKCCAQLGFQLPRFLADLNLDSLIPIFSSGNKP